jgi:cytochrome P450
MSDHPGTLPDPFAAEFLQNPYPAYRQLRQSGAVHLSTMGVPTYYRHADCSAILRDRRWGCGFSEERLQRVQRLGVAQVFMHQNPPEHTRLRHLVSDAFTPGSVATMRAHVMEVCDRLLDSALAGPETDLISAYAHPLPVMVIGDLLGVPESEREPFYGWSRALARGLSPDFAVTAEVIAQRREAIVDFSSYFASLAARRRKCPADDLVTYLSEIQDTGDLSEADLLATCVLIVVAGHETTASLIGNGTLALLRNPEQLAMVRDDGPEIADGAWVEELLRYEAPVQFVKRTALEDLDYGGRTYKRGEAVIVVMGSANRDDAVFADPDVLDFTRPNNHLAFSLGAHFCLGASLAHLEGSLAITRLLRRAPELRLAEDDPPYLRTFFLRGLERLPVRVGRRRDPRLPEAVTAGGSHGAQSARRPFP